MPFKFLKGHFGRRLSDAQVAELRRRYATEDVTQAQLAAEYGASQALVSSLLRFVHRKDVI